MVAPGVGIKEIQNRVFESIKADLIRIGLITDKENEWQQWIWFEHGISHWLGLDVHDVNDVKEKGEKGRILAPGMVLTIEPGLYISTGSLDFFPEYAKRAEPIASKEKIADITY